MIKTGLSIIFLLGMLISGSSYALNPQKDPLVFDDTPLREALELPDWFKLSFLDLQESLDEAVEDGKQGLIIYFGRKDCPYCKAQLEVNWGLKDIVEYTNEHYDVIAIDVTGQRTVTDFDGKTYTEKEFAARMRTDFTPSLLFYEKKGRLALRLPGYRPPYQFRAALEYVADAHYFNEPFGDYLARAEDALSYGMEELNSHDSFRSGPFNFDRSKVPGKVPLAVFFEHPICHACDILHGGPLSNPEVAAWGERFNEIYGNLPGDLSTFTWHGYDVVSALIEQVRSVAILGEDGNLYVPREALVQAVNGMTGYEGLTGTLTCYDGDCNSSGPFFLVVQDGEWVLP